MATERAQLTSLQAPPKGWFWSEEARERRRAQLGIGGKGSGKPTFVGPRDDAEPTAHLPTLTPGIDKLPRRCIFCGSGLLDCHEAMNGERRGMLSCTGCGRQLAWLAPRITAGPRPAAEPAIPPSKPIAALPAALTMRSTTVAQFKRLDGCGPGCRPLTGHDPITHERYGRERALAEVAEAAARPTGIVRTGPLAIDLDTADVTVDGEPVVLTAIEHGILAHCAGRLGTVCGFFQVVEDVWDRATAEQWSRRCGGYAAWHGMTTHLCRLRRKLGPAAVLLQRVPNRGLLLRAEPPILEAADGR